MGRHCSLALQWSQPALPQMAHIVSLLLYCAICVQWLSLEGYLCHDQLLNSIRSGFTSFLHSLNTKFCHMKQSLKLNTFEAAYSCFHFPFLLISLLFLITLLYYFSRLYGSLQLNNYPVFILWVVFKITLNFTLTKNQFSFLLFPVLLSSTLPCVYLL